MITDGDIQFVQYFGTRRAHSLNWEGGHPPDLAQILRTCRPALAMRVGQAEVVGYDPACISSRMPSPSIIPDIRVNDPAARAFIMDYFGIFGYVSFEAGNRLVGHAPPAAHEGVFMLPRRVVAYTEKSVTAVVIHASSRADYTTPVIPRQSHLHSIPLRTYLRSIRKTIDHIKVGDIYQANITQRFQVPYHEDTVSLFLAQIRRNPVPHWALLLHDHEVVSFSPELFIRIRDGVVTTRPIKGTRPRGRDPVEDQAMRTELLTSQKDLAELSMIVDLLRNDLARSALPGSVKVVEHARLESYENVHHLVSTVSARIPPGRESAWETFLRAFPGGSISGVPKRRALEIIQELEPYPRGVYTGSFFLLSAGGNLESTIAIRTMTIADGRAVINAGGGIVYDSVPMEEYLESLHKAKHLLAYLGHNFTGTVFLLNGELCTQGFDPEPQNPYNRTGAFETIRVVGGRPLRLDMHLRRLERGITHHRLDVALPSREELDLLIRANLADRARLNIMAWEGTVYARVGEYSPPEHIDLVLPTTEFDPPATDFKGLPYTYRHHLLPGAWDTLLHKDGMVLEGTRSTIYIWDGEWVTPEGPVLRGITRSLSSAVPRKVGIKDLLSSAEIAVSNSLIGFRAVRKVVDTRGNTLWQASGASHISELPAESSPNTDTL